MANVIDDTDNLSTRRGGGLMVLNAVVQLKDAVDSLLAQELKSPPSAAVKWEEIATGASIGLFRLELPDPPSGATEESDRQAEAIRQIVERHLREGALKYTDKEKEEKLPLQHGTFVVDVERVQGSESASVNRAIAANRWRQLQQPSVSLADLWPETKTVQTTACTFQNPACSLDFVRPAQVVYRPPGEQPASQLGISRSVAARRAYGRNSRQEFYTRELEHLGGTDLLEGYEFANHFRELSDWDDPERVRPKDDSGTDEADAPGPDEEGMVTIHEVDKSLAPPHLDDKIAVFYVDGNGFGKKGQEILKKQGMGGFREWSRALRGHHRRLLKELLERAKADASRKSQPKTPSPLTPSPLTPSPLTPSPLTPSPLTPSPKPPDRIRLETLLWGGDEIIWVVPAWKGWELVEWFFGQDHSVEVGGKEIKLTYGAGLVFCHANAPIKNITALAHQLGDLAKSASPTESRLAYEVLESFDDITGNLDEHRRRFLPPGSETAQLVLNPRQPVSFWETLNAVAASKDFPMRQLYRLVKLWRTGASATDQEACLARLRHDEELGKRLGEWSRTFSPEGEGGNPVCWLHLLQMLPYIPLRRNSLEVRP